MKSSQIIDRTVLSVTVALCLVVTLLTLLLDVQSLVVDLVYQGF
jgi:hypothetical protein